MNTSALEIIELDIPGVFELGLSPIGDERGYFMRTYDVAAMREAGLHREWVQENQSRNERKGILRGLHFQFPPAAETKLVRCTLGEVFDDLQGARIHRSAPSKGRARPIHPCLRIHPPSIAQCPRRKASVPIPAPR